MIPREVEEIIRREVLKKSNVVGYSKRIGRKVVGGRVTDIPCVTIYVSKKLPLSQLKAKDVVPGEIMGLKTDVVEVGELKFLKANKTSKCRPVLMGVSIGNYAITAGTAGWMFEKGGEVYLGSNAHVLADDPTKDPRGVVEKRIVQPGKYDGGTLNDVVGEHVWHKRVILVGEESSCPVARAIAHTYNSIAKLVKARTRLIPSLEEVNNIDFAVAKLTASFQLKFPDFDNRGYMFVGLGFAGSDTTSCVCKAKYIVSEGYKPVGVGVSDVGAGAVVEKSGRTSCHTAAEVVDPSAVVKVMYDAYSYAIFEDIILTTLLLQPGDSGSSVWVRQG